MDMGLATVGGLGIAALAILCSTLFATRPRERRGPAWAASPYALLKTMFGQVTPRGAARLLQRRYAPQERSSQSCLAPRISLAHWSSGCWLPVSPRAPARALKRRGPAMARRSKITYNSTAESLFQTDIVAIGLERLGYDVKPIVPLEIPAMYLAASTGDVDLTASAWEPLQNAYFDKAGGNGELERAESTDRWGDAGLLRGREDGEGAWDHFRLAARRSCGGGAVLG